MMKKWIAILVAVMMMATAMTAAAEAQTGGWTLIDAIMGTDADAVESAYAAFDKALESWDGADMVVADPLSMQVVAGTNYCYLVQIPVSADSDDFTWGITVVYEDLSGNASVSYVYPIGEASADETAAGGWSCAADFPEEYIDLFWDALYSIEDPDIMPYSFIVLNQQVVAGMNYELLCQYAVFDDTEESEDDAEEDSLPEPIEEGFALAVVYVDLENNASLTSFTPIDIPQQ